MARLADKAVEAGLNIQVKMTGLYVRQPPHYVRQIDRPIVVRLGLFVSAIGIGIGIGKGFQSVSEVPYPSPWLAPVLVGGFALFGGCVGYLAGTATGYFGERLALSGAHASSRLLTAAGRAALDRLTPHIPEIQVPQNPPPKEEPVRYTGNVIPFPKREKGENLTPRG
ncbi:MAG: hypothetical protein P4M15_12760 [Alphaproteobacteria bacterium]|nr:hypothetical protein [Alphaproteobacteria bacterium]